MIQKVYFFVGSVDGEGGPQNVNKGLVSNLSEKFCHIKLKNKILRYFEAVLFILKCKVIVVSGLSNIGNFSINLAKIFNKKIIYIMHGCYEIECRLNEEKTVPKSMMFEHNALSNATLILSVSKSFGNLISEEFPEYRDKISHLYNGVDRANTSIKFNHEHNKIIAIGGDRRVKNNIVIAHAMEHLCNVGMLNVFGTIYKSENLPQAENIVFQGRIPQEKLFAEFRTSELYVLNSIYEPFALSVFEALKCGCSILVSHVAGATELLKLTDNDIINDPMDENEIAKKIDFLLKNPNNERILKDVDFDRISYKVEADKLACFCDNICQPMKTNKKEINFN